MHFTEQMLSSLGKSNFPKNIQDTTGHIPDGLTVFSYSHRSFSVGYEVDLNLKDEDRYESTAEYYLQSKNRVSLIVWLVKNHWVYEKIHSVLTDKLKYEKEKVNERYAFILLEDFKKNIWNAKGVNGVFKDHTIQKLHANLLQSLGKAPPNLMQKDFSKIYFPIFKSPQKFMAYPEKELSI